MLSICWSWSWSGEAPYFLQQDLSWIDVKYWVQLMLSTCWWWSWSGAARFLFNMIFLELVSSICANWCRVFVGRGLGQVQAALVLLPPTSLPRPARRRPPPHLLRHQFFSQTFFLQIFTFSPASSITQKNKCCPITLVVKECALCPQVYYVQKLRAISDVPLVILLARVQI